MNNEALKNSYDVIVVGAGIGGLTSGALLAKEGKQVLVVEQEELAGGFARDFQYGPYRINPALHVIMGCNPTGNYGQGVIDAILKHIGVQDKCEFISVDPFYRACFPGFQLDVPTGRDAYLEAHLRHFPREQAGLHKLVDLCSTIYQEFMQFPSGSRWQDLALLPVRYPYLFRHANATVSKVVDRYLGDAKLKSVYSILYPYLALPPSRLSFLLWAVMMTSYIEQGAFHCLGGFQNLNDALADGLARHGGELTLGCKVNKILVNNRHVKGIMLDNGQEINAPVVISNIDARSTFQDLLEEEQVSSRYLRALKKMEASSSVLSLCLATDLYIQDLGVPKVTLDSPWDLDASYAAAMQKHFSGMAIHIPTIVDSSLAPANEHIVFVQAFVPSDAADLTPSEKIRFAESMLEKAETVLPELREHVTFVAGASDGSHYQYPLSRLDNIYGWANTTRQAGVRRLPNKTPITGLYLAGHWTQPGSGIWTVALSGVNAARYILGKNMSKAIWPLEL